MTVPGKQESSGLIYLCLKSDSIYHSKGKVRSVVPSLAFLQILIALNLDIDRRMIRRFGLCPY